MPPDEPSNWVSAKPRLRSVHAFKLQAGFRHRLCHCFTGKNGGSGHDLSDFFAQEKRPTETTQGLSGAFRVLARRTAQNSWDRRCIPTTVSVVNVACGDWADFKARRRFGPDSRAPLTCLAPIPFNPVQSHPNPPLDSVRKNCNQFKRTYE